MALFITFHIKLLSLTKPVFSSKVKVWFQNRRIKWRKQNLEQQQHKLAKYRALRDKERKSLQCDDNDPKVNDRFDEGDFTAKANITEENFSQDKERKAVTIGKPLSRKEGSFDDTATERTSSPNYLLQTHHELRVWRESSVIISSFCSYKIGIIRL